MTTSHKYSFRYFFYDSSLRLDLLQGPTGGLSFRQVFLAASKRKRSAFASKHNRLRRRSIYLRFMRPYLDHCQSGKGKKCYVGWSSIHFFS